MPDSSTISSRRRRARSWSLAATMRRSAAPATPMWSSRTATAKTCPRRWRMRRRTSMAEDLPRIQAMYLTGFILELTTVGTIVKNSRGGRGGWRSKWGDKRDGGIYDDDLFSLITVLNLGRCGDSRCIKEYVLVVCGHKDTKKTLRTTVASRSIIVLGLLLRKDATSHLIHGFLHVRKEGQSGFVNEGAGHGEDPAGIISSMVA